MYLKVGNNFPLIKVINLQKQEITKKYKRAKEKGK